MYIVNQTMQGYGLRSKYIGLLLICDGDLKLKGLAGYVLKCAPAIRQLALSSVHNMKLKASAQTAQSTQYHALQRDSTSRKHVGDLLRES